MKANDHFLTSIIDGSKIFLVGARVSLDDWLKNGWLVDHKTSPREIADLLALAVPYKKLTCDVL